MIILTILSNTIYPIFLRKIDYYLLRNNPILWMYRAHYIIYYSLIASLFLGVFTYTYINSLSKLYLFPYIYSFTIIIDFLFFLSIIVYMLQYRSTILSNEIKQYGHLFESWIAVFLIAILLVPSYLVTQVVIQNLDLNKNYSKEEGAFYFFKDDLSNNKNYVVVCNNLKENLHFMEKELSKKKITVHTDSVELLKKDADKIKIEEYIHKFDSLGAIYFEFTKTKPPSDISMIYNNIKKLKKFIPKYTNQKVISRNNIIKALENHASRRLILEISGFIYKNYFDFNLIIYFVFVNILFAFSIFGNPLYFFFFISLFFTPFSFLSFVLTEASLDFFLIENANYKTQVISLYIIIVFLIFSFFNVLYIQNNKKNYLSILIFTLLIMYIQIIPFVIIIILVNIDFVKDTHLTDDVYMYMYLRIFIVFLLISPFFKYTLLKKSAFPD